MRAFAEHVAGWTPEQRARVEAARPDTTRPAPGRKRGAAGPAGLAERLIDGNALAAVSTALPLGPTQVLVAVLLVGATTRPRLADLLGTDTTTLAPCLEHLLERALVWDDGEVVHPAPRLRRRVQPPQPLGPIVEEVVEQLTGTEADTALRKLNRRVSGPKNRQSSLAALHAALLDEALVRSVVSTAPPRVRKALAARFTPTGTADVTPAAMQHEQEALRWAEQHGLAYRNRRGGYGYGGWETYPVSPYDVFGLYSFGPALPREVVMALRPDGVPLPFDPVRPEIPVHTVSEEAVASAASAALHELTATATALVDELERAPLPQLRSGGVGVREVRRLAKLFTTDEATVRFALDVLGLRGLIADEHGALLGAPGGYSPEGDTVTVSPEGVAWRERDPAERALALATAWLAAPDHLTEPDQNGKPRPPLLLPEGCGGCAASRTALLSALARLGPLEATTLQQIAPAARWELPAAHAVHAYATDTPYSYAWQEAERAGLIARGALAPLGRLLLAGDEAGALQLLGGAMPSSIDEVLFGADLTAVVPGDPAAGVSRLLDSCADREGRGGAVVWRLSPGSVRRALDEGAGADGLLHRLESVAAGGRLPQPLVYLVRDVARTHGVLRVRPAVSVLRCPDEPLLAQVCADRALGKLGLVRIAPTVATTTATPEQVLTALRAAGYLPMPEEAGTVVDLVPGSGAAGTADARGDEPTETTKAKPSKPAQPEAAPAKRKTQPAARPSRAAASQGRPDRLAELAPQLKAHEHQLLLAALEGGESAGSEVEIEYVTVVGTRSRRRLGSLRLIGQEAGKTSLRATSLPDGEERTFRLDRIVAVHPVSGAEAAEG
ncbi:helicase-associated domain-containing protein [Quadrisphaera granulorum]|uniref:helicase-associated domain-containing protein n=1 Tax=Quadrisphaera granulorum TaxID=317664 RepID=UPI0011B687E5|nr:helicase-associated domain-containing protein [Quadrisphaera granulorum]